jgi:hypothetical protein
MTDRAHVVLETRTSAPSYGEASGEAVAGQAGTPAASALTSAVVSGFPPMPQSPLATSSTTTHVTARMFSPSIDTIASVRRSTISLFWSGEVGGGVKGRRGAPAQRL